MSGFYIAPDDVRKDRAILRGEEFHHAIHVKRTNIGDIIDAVDGIGNFYRIEIDSVESDRLEGHIVFCDQNVGEPEYKVTLAQSLIRGNRFDLVVEKAVEVGIYRIVPVISCRTVRALKGKTGRWRKIAKSAMKQSGRSRLPQICNPLPLDDSLCLLNNDTDVLLMAWEGETEGTLKDALSECKGVESVGVVIGPEGGFTKEEVQIARKFGASTFSLGPTKLKSETAGVVSTALVLYQLRQTV